MALNRGIPFIVLGAFLFNLVQAVPFADLSQSPASVSNPISTPVADSLNPYPHKRRLTFNTETRKFRLTVFSDLHFGENPWDTWGPKQDVDSLKVMRMMLDVEQPDYVVINGDLITGENTFASNATRLVDILTKPLVERSMQFSSTYGNHDNQANISHLDELLREQQVAKCCSWTRRSPIGVGGQGGEGNYWVPIWENEEATSPSLVLWFFDSRGGWSKPNPKTGEPSYPYPDWVDKTVADWIASETKKMDAAWGPAGTSRAAIGFVHIPPHVMEGLQPSLDSSKEPGLNADHLGQGSTQSSDNPQEQGRDIPFWDSLNSNVKNLHTIVSGHDHGNEWCKRDPVKDVVLCFNKHTGHGGYGLKEWGYGVRTFDFSLDTLTDSVETWIRMEDGSTHAHITLDKSYSSQ
jgi:hypothetical protein